MDGFDDKGVVRSAVFRVLPEALHSKICNVGCISLRFMCKSSSNRRAIVRPTEEFSNVSRSAGEGSSCFKLLSDITLVGVNTVVAFKVKGLDYSAFLRRNIHDGEFFTMGEVLFE